MHREQATISITVPAGSAQHLIWMPKYHCAYAIPGGPHGARGNLFHFGSSGVQVGGDTVDNTLTLPWANSPGCSSLRDPCYQFLDKAGVRDARTVSACIDLEYTGKADSECGLVTGFTAQLGNFWEQKEGADALTLASYTYDDVFALGTHPVRPGQGLHVKHVPNFAAGATEFYGSNHSPVAIGVTAVAMTATDADRLRTEDPSIIGVAFSAGPADTTFRMTLTKIIEYREDSYVGGLRSSPVQSTPPTVTPLENAAKDLNPDTGWQSTWGKVASMAGDVLNRAYANRDALARGGAAAARAYNRHRQRRLRLHNDL